MNVNVNVCGGEVFLAMEVVWLYEVVEEVFKSLLAVKHTKVSKVKVPSVP